jgi:hypothetical protein
MGTDFTDMNDSGGALELGTERRVVVCAGCYLKVSLVTSSATGGEAVWVW